MRALSLFERWLWPVETRDRMAHRRAPLAVERLEGRDLPSGSPTLVLDEVLIGFKPGMSEAAIGHFYADYGLVERESLNRSIRSDAVRMKVVARPSGSTTDLIPALERDVRVEYAEPNTVLSAMPAAVTPTEPIFPAEHYLSNTGQWGGTPHADIHAREAWEITTGSPNALVAVLDSGVDYDHPDLRTNMWTNPFETPGDGIDNDDNGYVDDVHGIDALTGSGDPMDNGVHGGHGTAVAGVIGATPFNDGTVGVAWQVGIIAVKVISERADFRLSDLVRAFEYVNHLKNVEHQNIVATNNSYGYSDVTKRSRALRDAMAGVEQPGMSPILHVCAAMNDNRDIDAIPRFPAAFDLPNIITVAATDGKDRYASFSNYGATSVDLAAPGAWGIQTTVPGGRYTYGFAGTSAAAPQVAGAAALVWSSFPDSTALQIKQRLLTGVDPIGPIAENVSKPTLTNGRLNIINALTGASPSHDHTAPSAVATLAVVAADFHSLTLAWRATGDDGTFGRASFYDLRYSTKPISNTNWSGASRVTGETKPEPPGSREYFTITGLEPDTHYYFALHVRDEMGNESGRSNITHGTTERAKSLYSDEHGTNEWTTTGLWHRSNHNPEGLGESWYYGDDATQSYNTGDANSGMLISPKIKLKDASHPVLAYREWREVEDSTFGDSAIVQVKTHGGEWETLSQSEFSTSLEPLNWQSALQFNGVIQSDYDEPHWVTRVIDLSAFVGKSLTVRFVFDTVDEIANDFEGWYVRDVRLYDGLKPSPHGPGRESASREVAAVPIPEAPSTASIAPGARSGAERSTLAGKTVGLTNSSLRGREPGALAPTNRPRPSSRPIGGLMEPGTGKVFGEKSAASGAMFAVVELVPERAKATVNSRVALQPFRWSTNRSECADRDWGTSKSEGTSDAEMCTESASLSPLDDTDALFGKNEPDLQDGGDGVVADLLADGTGRDEFAFWDPASFAAPDHDLLESD